MGNMAYYRVEDEKFRPPKYLLRTQSQFYMRQNSFRAFVLYLQGRNCWVYDESRNTSWEILEKDYRRFCEHFSCPEMKVSEIVPMLSDDYGVQKTVDVVEGLLYNGLTFEEDGKSADELRADKLQQLLERKQRLKEEYVSIKLELKQMENAVRARESDISDDEGERAKRPRMAQSEEKHRVEHRVEAQQVVREEEGEDEDDESVLEYWS